MLVLTRKPGERINMTGGITIQVLRKRGGGGVSLGILAPPHVRIMRDELEPDPAPRIPQSGATMRSREEIEARLAMLRAQLNGTDVSNMIRGMLMLEIDQIKWVLGMTNDHA